MVSPLDPERRQVDDEARRSLRSLAEFLQGVPLWLGDGDLLLALLDECDRLHQVVERVEGLPKVWESDADGLRRSPTPNAGHEAAGLSRAARNLRSALASVAPEQGED